MSRPCAVNCIIPPHILRKLLQSNNAKVSRAALSTMLSTAHLRGQRTLIAGTTFAATVAKEKRRTIYNCEGHMLLDQATLARSEGAPAVADKSVNAAYDGLGKTYDFYKSVLGRNSIDGRGMRLNGYVHFGQSYNNAYWDGRQMVFGDGDGQIFKDLTGSLDVIAHELTHGVTEFTCGLVYHVQSGALNESISDVFGSLVKQWSRSETADEADWLIGADIFTPDIKADALRSLKNPGSAYDNPIMGKDPQPAHMDDFHELADTEEEDWGGVHINSGIPNRAFYLTATRISGNAWEAPGHIWFEALKACQPTTDFADFALRTHEAAGTLYGTGSSQQAAVREAWDEVGVPLKVPGVRGRRAAATADVRMTIDSQAVLEQRLQAIAEQVAELSTRIQQQQSLPRLHMVKERTRDNGRRKR